MVRKSSDMVMLLGSRGRARSRGYGKGGFGKKLSSYIDSLLGRANWRQERTNRHPMVPSWMALAAVLVAFGGGYLLGGGIGKAQAAGKAELKAPGFVNDARPLRLAANGFPVAVYRNVPEADAEQRAKALSKYLQDSGLGKAKEYVYEGAAGRGWMVVVYFDGDNEKAMTRSRLLALPTDVPDPYFVQLRNAQANTEAGWPRDCPIQ